MSAPGQGLRTWRPFVGIALLSISLTLIAIPFGAAGVAHAEQPAPSSNIDHRPPDGTSQKALADAQRERAALERATRTREELRTQTEARRRADIQQAATLTAQSRGRGVAESGERVAVTATAVSLVRCDEVTGHDTTVSSGTPLELIGPTWLAKNRGLIQDFIRGSTVTASIAGVAIPNAARYLTAPATVDDPDLGVVWFTRWAYPFTLAPPQSAALVEFRWTLDHPIVDLLTYDIGHPHLFQSGMTRALSCTLRSGIRVTGRVTGEGAPIADAIVSALDVLTGLPVRSVNADATGEFVMTLDAGSYRFAFQSAAGPWIPEAWDDKIIFSQGAIVVLTPSATPLRLTADLERGVFLSGHVTDASTHSAVANVIVNAQQTEGVCCFGARTGADGSYRMVVRKNVSLKVGFDPSASTAPYLQQWWHGRASFDAADPLVVGSVDVGGIDAALERGVFVRGRVTDAVTHVPLANVGLSASNTTAPCCENFFASTGTDGTYALAVRRASSIIIGFFPQNNALPYIPTYWNGKRSFSAADRLVIGASDVGGIDAQIERGAYMRGRVTDAETGAGVLRTTVVASVADELFFAFTSADGTYAMAVRSNVALRVQFFPPSDAAIPYVSEYYRDRASAADADLVTATTSDVLGIDAALDRGVFLRGHVTDAVGAALAGIQVSAQRAGVACCESFFTQTDIQGDYALAVRKNIVVNVGFLPQQGSPYVEEWYNDRPSFSAADPVTIGTTDIVGVNAALARGVIIRGRVTDAEAHGPIGNVVINGYLGAACCDTVFATTNADGEYALRVLVGSALKLFFSPPSGGTIPYVGQFYRGRPTFDTADVVTVGSADLSGIDAELQRGVYMRGIVTDASTGAAISNAFVNVQRADAPCCEQYSASTGTDGRYSLTLPRAISVRVSFQGPFDDPIPHLLEYWSDRRNFTDADVLAIGSIDRDGIDAALDRGVFVRGRVTDASSGEGLRQAFVSAFVTNAPCCENYFASTSESGDYRMTVRPNVQLRINFQPPFGSELVAEYYNDRSDFSSADLVSVGTADLLGIDAALARGLHIRGRVTDRTGGGVANASVNAESGDVCCGFIAGTQTAADGTYALTLTPGRYKVRFFPPAGSSLLSEYYDNEPSWNDATVIEITTTDASGVDAVLETGAMLSGRITGPDGAGLANASANVYTAVCCTWIVGVNTGFDGSFSVAVPAGAYKINLSPPFGSDLLEEFYNDKHTFEEADVVLVGATAVTGIDAALERGTRVSGRVTDPEGNGVAFATVGFYDPGPCCRWIIGFTTAGDGTYSAVLRPGTYKIGFSAPFGSDLLGEYYDNSVSFDGALSVVVTVGVPLEHIDATLARGARVSGRVTAAATGLGVPNVTVSVQMPVCCQPVFSVGTASDGTYSVTLAPGTYKIGFFPPPGDLRYEFWDDKLEFDIADELIVGPGGRSGVNAALANQ